MSEASEVMLEYWRRHYARQGGLCSLCGQSGVIDTRCVATPAGVEVGGLNPCICPNGQSMREHGRVVGVIVDINTRRPV